MPITYYDQPRGFGGRGGQGYVGGPVSYGTVLFSSADEARDLGFVDVSDKVHSFLDSQGHGDVEFTALYYNPEKKLFANYYGRGAAQLQTDPHLAVTDNSPFWAGWLDTLGAALKGWIAARIGFAVVSLGSSEAIAEGAGELASEAGAQVAAEEGASLAAENLAGELAPAVSEGLATEGANMGLEDFVGDIPLADDLSYVDVGDLGGSLAPEVMVGPAIDVSETGAFDQGVGLESGGITYQSPSTLTELLQAGKPYAETGLKVYQAYTALQGSNQLAAARRAASNPANNLAPTVRGPINLNDPTKRIAAAPMPQASRITAPSSTGPVGAIVAIGLVVGAVIYFHG